MSDVWEQAKKQQPMEGGPEQFIDATDVDGTGGYYYGKLVDFAALDNPASVPIVWDKEAIHGGKVNVLWANFKVTNVDGGEFAALLQEKAELYVEPPSAPGD
jgi:hypothetical protein